MTASFIHLRVHTAYSLAEGAIRVKQVPSLCRQHKMPAVAMTDTANLFGALEFSVTCAKDGVQPIIGCQLNLTPYDANQHSQDVQPDQLIAIAQNQIGYQNLIKLVSQSYYQMQDGEPPQITFEQLEKYAQGLILLTGGPKGTVGRHLLQKNKKAAASFLDRLCQIAPTRVYIELMRHGLAEEEQTEDGFIQLAMDKNIPLVATNEVFFDAHGMHEAHDALLCIAGGRYVMEDDRRKETPEHYFKSPQEMAELFSDIHEAIQNTVNIAKRCSFMPEPVGPMLPPFLTESGLSEKEEMRKQAKEGLDGRLKKQVYEEGQPQEKRDEIRNHYFERLEYEMGIIERMGFPGYFLIVADFIKWAKEQDIPVGPGRGSGAGSLVAWALTITDIDPIRFGLIFERFLNPERVSMPDFDVDFCQDRRDEVIDYVCQKYGKDHVAQIITFGKLQARAVVRDVGRVLQMPYGQVDKICKMIPNNPASPVTLKEAVDGEVALQLAQKEDPTVKKLISIGKKLEGLYRHASTHAAGVVIGGNPIDDAVPLYKDDKGGLLATQFNMKYVEQAGLLKFDFLGLKTLTVIEDCCKLLRAKNITIDMAKIPLDDKKTFELLGKIQTVGVFQLESSGMREVLRKMQPEKFEYLIALNALYRPGPMDDIPRYLSCMKGEEKVSYLHPSLEPILKETYGVMVYQEQVMNIAQVLGGYSLGAADLLRRAMGKKIKSEMDAQRVKFTEGAVAKGVKKDAASQIFDQMAKFAGYGFNKSHSAPYALLSYQTAYLKANYPHEFYAASMTLDIHNTDKLNIFRQDIADMGIKLLPPDINKSMATFSVEEVDGEKCVRYGLAAVKSVGMGAMESLEIERKKNGAFKDMADFARRLDRSVNKRMLEKLIASGAMDSMHDNRAELFSGMDMLLKEAATAHEERNSQQTSLFGDGMMETHATIKLPQASPWGILEQLQNEFAALGFFMSAHPLDIYGEALTEHGVKYSDQLSGLSDGTLTKMAGIVLSKQIRASKKGQKFAFVQLSDTRGVFEVAVFSEVFTKSHDLLEAGQPLMVSANTRMEEDGSVRLTAQGIGLIDESLNARSKAIEIQISPSISVQQLKDILTSKAGGGSPILLKTEVSGQPIQLDLPGKYKIDSDARSRLLGLAGVDSLG